MKRAYQSPCLGTACGPQCAQMPNLASRNHSGVWYVISDSTVGSKRPGTDLGSSGSSSLGRPDVRAKGRAKAPVESAAAIDAIDAPRNFRLSNLTMSPLPLIIGAAGRHNGVDPGDQIDA